MLKIGLRANLALIAAVGLLALLALACATQPVITPPPTPVTLAPRPVFARIASFRVIPLSPPLAPSPIPTCHVAATCLHLRSCAGMGCSAQDWLPQGTVITPTGAQAGTWWEVSTPAGVVGWIYAEFITCP